MGGYNMTRRSNYVGHIIFDQIIPVKTDSSSSPIFHIIDQILKFQVKFKMNIATIKIAPCC